MVATINKRVERKGKMNQSKPADTGENAGSQADPAVDNPYAGTAAMAPPDDNWIRHPSILRVLVAHPTDTYGVLQSLWIDDKGNLEWHIERERIRIARIPRTASKGQGILARLKVFLWNLGGSYSP